MAKVEQQVQYICNKTGDEGSIRESLCRDGTDTIRFLTIITAQNSMNMAAMSPFRHIGLVIWLTSVSIHSHDHLQQNGWDSHTRKEHCICKQVYNKKTVKQV